MYAESTWEKAEIKNKRFVNQLQLKLFIRTMFLHPIDYATSYSSVTHCPTKCDLTLLSCLNATGNSKKQNDTFFLPLFWKESCNGNVCRAWSLLLMHYGYNRLKKVTSFCREHIFISKHSMLCLKFAIRVVSSKYLLLPPLPMIFILFQG